MAVTYTVQLLTCMTTYTTFDDIYYYHDSIHYRDMLLYYRDSGKIWLLPSPISHQMLLAYGTD